MSGILGLLSNAIGGGLIGAIGSGVTKYLDTKKEIELKRLDQAHELALSAHEKDMAEMQLKSAHALATLDANAKIAVADYGALEASLAADKATYSKAGKTKHDHWLVLVDVVRGLTRPTLTATLVVYCVAVTAYVLVNYGTVIDSTEMAAVLMIVIDSMTFSSNLAISWWFGSRGHKK